MAIIADFLRKLDTLRMADSNPQAKPIGSREIQDSKSHNERFIAARDMSQMFSLPSEILGIPFCSMELIHSQA
jgi:hypothetical protein